MAGILPGLVLPVVSPHAAMPCRATRGLLQPLRCPTTAKGRLPAPPNIYNARPPGLAAPLCWVAQGDVPLLGCKYRGSFGVWVAKNPHSSEATVVGQ